MPKKTNASVTALEPIIVRLASVQANGGYGHLGRPFRVNHPLGAGPIFRMKATSEEKARANNFRDLLRDLSPDFDMACRKHAPDAPAVSDAEIEEVIGPILEEHGYDIKELAIKRQKSRSVRKAQMTRPTVFELNLTEPFKELRKLQVTLEMIVRHERWSHAAAYRVPVMQESGNRAAVFAPLLTWEKTVAGDDRDKLVGHMRRVYKRLASVAGSETEFRQCRIVHFMSCDQADGILNLQQSSGTKELGIGNGPVVIVEGETVVAALPRDEGNCVTSATVAVEVSQGEFLQSNEGQVLPDMNAIIAQAEGTLAADMTQLS